VDVLGQNRCVVKLEDSNILLEGIKQQDLETMVPLKGNKVRVVLGEFKGQKGTVLEKHVGKNQLHVQLDEELDIHVMDLDDVATCK